MLREGSIVDASIIATPTSTKNKAHQRDPEMHQSKKGNSWNFGMKMHIDVIDALRLIHSIATTSANAHDITEADKLLHDKAFAQPPKIRGSSCVAQESSNPLPYTSWACY